MTMMDDDDSVFAAMRAGARGYLLKGASPDDIERAVHAVARGEVLLGPQVAARATRLHDRFADDADVGVPAAHGPRT